jgi:hypothetical protein
MIVQRRIANLLISVGPPLIALLAVWREPFLTAWAHKHEAVLPLGLFLLLLSLLHSRLRHLLVISLCYGVSFLALRDVFLVYGQPLPPQLDYDFIAASRPTALLLVSILAMIAAVVETIRPGSVWARRCYFGAAALYFIGTGVINFCFNHSWQSVMLAITGVTALFGCLYAHRIIASELQPEEEEAEISDVDLQQRTEAAHLRALQAKEWHDLKKDEG